MVVPALRPVLDGPSVVTSGFYQVHLCERRYSVLGRGRCTQLSKKTTTLLSALHGAEALYCAGTATHSARVGLICGLLAETLGLSEPDADVDAMRWVGMLHDIGKLAVRLEVLRKAGPLTSDEWEEVKKHPIVGSDLLLAFSPNLAAVALGVRAHHEAYFILSCGARCSIDGAEVASLGTGQFVGEMSLLDRGPLSAPVVADSDMVLEPREFDRLIQASPKIARKLLVEMATGFERSTRGSPTDPRLRVEMTTLDRPGG